MLAGRRGACPLSADDQLRAAAESGGAGAIVLPSLFDEQIVAWNQTRSSLCNDRFDSEPITQVSDPIWQSGEAYLSFVNRASTLASIPVIASLNGHHAEQWIDYADELEEAGAAAIELNIHHGPVRRFQNPRQIEALIVEVVREINASVTIPIFVKLSHQYTSISHLARELQSGAQGLVLFGRLPDVNIGLDEIQPRVEWGLTASGSITQSLGTIMQVHGYCPSMPLAASGGIGSASDLIKSLLAGADVGMVTSAIYRDGIEVVARLIDGLIEFMECHQMKSMRDLQTRRPLEFATDQERANYMQALSNRLDSDQVEG